MLRYEPELGTLTFKMISLRNLTKAEARQYVAELPKNARNVHAEQLVVTLRSLVTSTLSFDNGQHSAGESCTIAMAFKLVNKDGTALLSNGGMEAELLQAIQTRYAEHGLDY